MVKSEKRRNSERNMRLKSKGVRRKRKSFLAASEPTGFDGKL